MGMNVEQKLISSHLVSGEMNPGSEIGLRIDQTLTQDATGTVVMLELEAMALDRVRTEVRRPVRRPQSAAGGRAQCRGSPVPAQRLPAVRAVVLQAG